jgi:peptidoglycan/LPS O-acetylase OafA/YrhL
VKRGTLPLVVHIIASYIAFVAVHFYWIATSPTPVSWDTNTTLFFLIAPVWIVLLLVAPRTLKLPSEAYLALAVYLICLFAVYWCGKRVVRRKLAK